MPPLISSMIDLIPLVGEELLPHINILCGIVTISPPSPISTPAESKPHHWTLIGPKMSVAHFKKISFNMLTLRWCLNGRVRPQRTDFLGQEPSGCMKSRGKVSYCPKNS